MNQAPVINAADLRDLLKNPDTVLLDVRSHLTDHEYGKRVYLQDHIPSARRVDLENDVTGVKSGKNGRHPLPDLNRFSLAMKRLGISRDSRVVIYDDAGMSFAARLWFTLLLTGFDSASVLNGGYAAWKKAGFETTADIPDFAEGDFTASAPLTRAFSVDEVLANIEEKQFTLLDARSAERYRGETEPIDALAGHIPGSLNRPSNDNFTDEGLFKAPELLRKEFSELPGLWLRKRVVHSCGSGVSACCNLLAMAYAGLPSEGVYVGSWSEWISDSSRPCAGVNF